METTRPVYWGMVPLRPSAWSGGQAVGAGRPAFANGTSRTGEKTQL